MKNWTDAALFSALKQGNKEAISILFLRHNGYLLHYGLRIFPDRALVEDCIQDLFVHLYEFGQKSGNIQNIKAYLFKSLRRRVVDRHKKESKRKIRESEGAERIDIQFATADLLLISEDQIRLGSALNQALNNLPWRQREAIYLRYYNGLSTREIAEVMGVANQTVLNTLYQALKNLREHEQFFNLIGILLAFFLLSRAIF